MERQKTEKFVSDKKNFGENKNIKKIKSFKNRKFGKIKFLENIEIGY